MESKCLFRANGKRHFEIIPTADLFVSVKTQSLGVLSSNSKLSPFFALSYIEVIVSFAHVNFVVNIQQDCLQHTDINCHINCSSTRK